jgi:UDP-3-O-[3-hydroxymyristoyl] glucosamine N-acyltransferase
MKLTLRELAERIGAEVAGDSAIEVESAGTLEDAEPGQISFLANPKYAKQLQTTRASAVIVGLDVRSDRVALLKTKDPYYGFAQAMVALHGHRVHPHRGIHPAAHVDPTAVIGQNTVVYPGAYIGPRVRIGQDCVIHPNAVIYEDCVLGDRVIVHANATLGGDGFGYSTHRGVHHKIPQVGNVVIEDDVEIGPQCAIDRASMGSTVIGKGTKLNSLVAIGHGVKVGPYGMIVAQVGVAGSVTIGHHATLAGQVGVAGHLKLGDNIVVAARSGVMNDIPDQTIMLGEPAMPASRARRVYSVFLQLPEMLDRIKKLEGSVAELGEDPTETI